MTVPFFSLACLFYGLLLFIAWLVTAARSVENIGTLFFSSIWVFALPISIIFLLYNFAVPFSFVLTGLSLLLIEEMLKLVAAKWVSTPGRPSLFLLSLFGIWEVLLVKVALPFVGMPILITLSRTDSLYYAFIMCLSVVAHGWTAIIYSCYTSWGWTLRFCVCLLLHWIFNQSRFMYDNFREPPPMLALIDALVLVLILYVLWAIRPRDFDGTISKSALPVRIGEVSGGRDD